MTLFHLSCALTTSIFICISYVESEVAWHREHDQFHTASRRGRNGPATYVYPEHLAGSFPSFASWLNRHISSLRREGFPISSELIELHCTPSDVALSYKAMWSHGCHYRSSSGIQDQNVTFDSGIASVTEDASTLDVGILKDILLISYGKLNCVVMQGDWIKSSDQGRAAIRKDRLGFWSVLYNARDRGPHVNPFVFPSNVSQVFFMEDGVDAEWKIVLQHEPRSRRVTEEKEFPDFVSAGTEYPLPNGALAIGEAVAEEASVPVGEDDIVDAGTVRHLDDEAAGVDEEAFLDIADYEEEVALEYVE